MIMSRLAVVSMVLLMAVYCRPQAHVHASFSDSSNHLINVYLISYFDYSTDIQHNQLIKQPSITVIYQDIWLKRIYT